MAKAPLSDIDPDVNLSIVVHSPDGLVIYAMNK